MAATKISASAAFSSVLVRLYLSGPNANRIDAIP
jgi:hypothetical protein